MKKIITIRNAQRIWGVLLLLVPFMIARESYLFFTGSVVNAKFFVIYSILLGINVVFISIDYIFPCKRWTWKGKNDSETSIEFGVKKK